MKSRTIEVHTNKIKALGLFLGCLIFTVLPILLYNEVFENKDLSRKAILIIGIIFFGSGALLFFILLIRKKPMLKIDNEKVVIYKLHGKIINIPFKNIKSVDVWTTRGYNGLTTNRQLVFELKAPSEEYKKSFYYRLIKNVSTSKVANSQYAIQTGFLNIDYKKLEKLINERISTCS